MAYALALLLAAGYVVAGVVGLAADVADGGDLVIWLVLLLGGAALILAGLYFVPRWSLTSAVLVGIGAVAGAVGLFWSIIVPILVLVLIGLMVVAVRRGAPATA